MKNKQPTPSNYVRIVYLKQMKQNLTKEQEDTSFTKNSLAYLSSLIQQDNKKRMSQSAKVSVDWTKTADINDTPKNHHYISSKNTEPISFKRQKSIEPRKLVLNKLLNDNNNFKVPLIQIHRPKSRTLKFTFQGVPIRQNELQSSFKTFCDQLKSGQTKTEGKQLKVSQKRQPDKVIYINDLTRKIPENTKAKSKSINSQTRNPKLFQRHNIVYRKNFKQINNFDWGKVADKSFDMSHIKYS